MVVADALLNSCVSAAQRLFPPAAVVTSAGVLDLWSAHRHAFATTLAAQTQGVADIVGRKTYAGLDSAAAAALDAAAAVSRAWHRQAQNDGGWGRA
jgi:hypothetical protein